MSSLPQPSSVAILVDFLERVLEDKSRGRLRSLPEYQRLYPGYEVEVEREYEQLLDLERIGKDGTRAVPVPRRIRYGKYETAKELGSGGQGVVYLARHVQLDKDVALKVLPEGRMKESDILRFEREARLAAQIDHPGLCPVFDFGFEEGEAYLAMSYVPGQTLASQIEDHRTSAGTASHQFERERIRHAVAIVEAVARAVHVAHETGILHQDIKPSNIMVRPDGSPVVLDFGIARNLDLDNQRPCEPIFGTPPYMAPEQFVPDEIPPDRRVDVFALGAVLYELVTLRRAFEAPLRRGPDGRPLRPTPEDPCRLVQRVDRDLSLIISTALAFERADRYLTALDLAEDLRAFLDNRPIRAVPPSLPHRCRRWMQRNPRLASSIAALFLTLATGLVVSLVLMSMARSAEAKTVWENYKNLIRSANLSLESGDTAAAREQLAACPDKHRGIEWDRLMLLADSSEAVLLRDENVGELVRFPDSATRFGVRVGDAVKILDLGEPEVSARSLGGGVTKVRGLSEDRILVEESSGGGHGLQRRDLAFGTVGESILLRGPTLALTTTDDGTRIAYSDQPGEILIVRGGEVERLPWSVRTGDEVTQLQFSAGGETLAAASGDGPLIVFDANNLTTRRSIGGRATSVRAFAFSADGLRLLVATSDPEVPGSDVVTLWDLVSEPARPLFHSPSPLRIGVVTSLLVHTSGDVFAGTKEGGIHWLSPDLRVRLGVLRGHAAAINSLVLDTTGQWLLSSSADGSVRSWSTVRPVDSYLLDWPTDRPVPVSGITSVVFDGSGDRLLTGTSFGDMELWDLDIVKAPSRYQVRDASTVGFAWGGTALAYIGFASGQELGIRELNGGRQTQLPVKMGQGAGPTLIDGLRSRIIYARDSGTWIQSLDNPEAVEPLLGSPATPGLLAMSHDGNRIAGVTRHGFHWWDLTEGTSRTIAIPLAPPRPSAGTLTLDREGRKLAYVDPVDSRVLLYDLDSGSDEPETLDHLARVTAIAFSPVQNRLAAATVDHQVLLWDYLRGEILLSMGGLTRECFKLAFSPQGDRLAASSLLEDWVRVWELRGREPRVFLSGGLPGQIDYRPPTLVDRLRRASKLVSRPRPDTIVSRPFYPREWYELAREALPFAQRTDYRMHVDRGLAALRLGELAQAEQDFHYANESGRGQYGMPIERAVVYLAQCQFLRGDSEAAQATLGTLPRPPSWDRYWEMRMLLDGSADARTSYRYVQDLTLGSDTMAQARAALDSRELPSPVHDIAVDLLDHTTVSPTLYHYFAWLCALTPDLDEKGREQALVWARRAVEQEPTTRRQLTLAAALYRAGKIDDALERLRKIFPGRQSEKLIHAALMCLCQFAAGDEDGWQAYNEFIVLAQVPQFRNDGDVADLKAEIEGLKKPEPPWR